MAAVLGIFFCYRRKKRATLNRPAEPVLGNTEVDSKHYTAVEIYSDSHPAAERTELDGWTPSEMEGNPKRKTFRAELPS